MLCGRHLKIRNDYIIGICVLSEKSDEMVEPPLLSVVLSFHCLPAAPRWDADTCPLQLPLLAPTWGSACPLPWAEPGHSSVRMGGGVVWPSASGRSPDVSLGKIRLSVSLLTSRDREVTTPASNCHHYCTLSRPSVDSLLIRIQGSACPHSTVSVPVRDAVQSQTANTEHHNWARVGGEGRRGAERGRTMFYIVILPASLFSCIFLLHDALIWALKNHFLRFMY